jgi:hypothetical protein
MHNCKQKHNNVTDVVHKHRSVTTTQDTIDYLLIIQ